MRSTKDSEMTMDAGEVQLDTVSTGVPVSSVPEGEWLLGTFVEFDEQGRPLVRVVLEGQWHTLPATPVIAISRSDLGRQAVLMRPGASLITPLLMGFVHTPLTMALSQSVMAGGEPEESNPASYSIGIDEKPARELILEGQEKVVLRCGAASITLTESGKIILRGEHLVSRSHGVNRILGASIQMN